MSCVNELDIDIGGFPIKVHYRGGESPNQVVLILLGLKDNTIIKKLSGSSKGPARAIWAGSIWYLLTHGQQSRGCGQSLGDHSAT